MFKAPRHLPWAEEQARPTARKHFGSLKTAAAAAILAFRLALPVAGWGAVEPQQPPASYSLKVEQGGKEAAFVFQRQEKKNKGSLQEKKAGVESEPATDRKTKAAQDVLDLAAALAMLAPVLILGACALMAALGIISTMKDAAKASAKAIKKRLNG